MSYKSKNKNIILSYRVDNNGIKTSAYEESMILDYPDINSWVVYIDCDYFNFKADIFRNMPLDGLDKDMAKLKKQVKNTVREFIKSKHKEYFVFIEKLKNDEYYPYKEGTQSSSKEYTFNHLAYFIEEDYSLLKSNLETRKIIYQLLDKAMCNGDIIDILESILSLDDKKTKMFRELLEKTDISDVIKFTTEVARKQIFLNFLNRIIYGDLAKHIKERKHLQKIIENNMWLFGEEYSSSPAVFSDKNLKNSLEELKEKYFDYQPTQEDDNLINFQNVKIADITDILVYNHKPMQNKRHEIMIVELKAPSVRISMKELDQARKYKQDIEKLGKFSKLNTIYKLILISSEISSDAKSEVGVIDKNRPTLYQKSKDYDIEVHVMVWSDIIDERRQYLNYLGNYLETKDIDLQDIFNSEYPDLDINNLPIPTKKVKK